MYALLLVIVGVCVYVLYQKSTTNATNLDNGIIEQLEPAPDNKVLQQSTVGIDLAPGYEASLTLNGTPLPDDELTVVPQLSQYRYTPGAGKTFETLPTGNNCIVATYWQTALGPTQSSTRSWCFTVL